MEPAPEKQERKYAALCTVGGRMSGNSKIIIRLPEGALPDATIEDLVHVGGPREAGTVVELVRTKRAKE
jgi:hypothetical protein